MNLRRHVAQVIARYQRRSHDCPQAEVRAILGRGHAAVADFEHVGIIPVTWSGKGVQFGVFINDVEHAIAAAVARAPLLFACPAVLNVAGRAPEVAAGLFSP